MNEQEIKVLKEDARLSLKQLQELLNSAMAEPNIAAKTNLLFKVVQSSLWAHETHTALAYMVKCGFLPRDEVKLQEETGKPCEKCGTRWVIK